MLEAIPTRDVRFIQGILAILLVLIILLAWGRYFFSNRHQTGEGELLLKTLDFGHLFFHGFHLVQQVGKFGLGSQLIFHQHIR